MRKIVILISLLFIFGCAKPQAPVVLSSIDWIRDMGVAQEIAKTQDKPILIDFYTEWCGWCKRLDKDTYSNKEVQESLEKFVCVKIDAEENKALAKEYKVNGFPSTVFLRSSGQLIEVVPGYLPPQKFLKLLDRMLSKAE